jgi:capsule polysaccharide export protein KpsE/RkpR
MVKKFDLINQYDEKDLEFAMVAFEDKMELKVTEEGTLNISVIDKKPEIAKAMVVELLTKLDSVNQQLGMDKGRFNREFLEQRLNETKTDLAIAEIRLKDFQEKTGIIDIVSQISAQYEAYGQIYIQEMQAYGQLYNQEMIAYTELYSLKAQTEIQLNVSKVTLNPNNPAVKRYEIMLNEQEKQLDLITSSLDKQLLDIILGFEKIEGKNLINELEHLPTMINFDNFPGLGMENARLIRELTIQNTLLELLLPQYETARLEESKNIPTLQVIDEPKVAINKTKPIRSLIVIASVIMAFLLSIVYIYLDYYSVDFRKQLKTI